MSDEKSDDLERKGSDSGFPDFTRKSLIQRVKSGDENESLEALNEFSKIYWKPLHSFLTYQNVPEDEARDLVQGFFAKHLIEKGLLRDWKPEKGKLRTFLLHVLINHRAHARKPYSRNPLTINDENTK